MISQELRRKIRIEPFGRIVEAEIGEVLQDVLRHSGFAPDAPCGGRGTCGKCRVTVNGEQVLACKTKVDGDMTVLLDEKSAVVLTEGAAQPLEMDLLQEGHLLVLDIGTTTLAGVLLDGTSGQELSAFGMANPQAVYGADVISRVQAAISGEQEQLTHMLQKALEELTLSLCKTANIQATAIGTVSVVGNPAMQQFFLGICPENLAQLPFDPVLTHGEVREAASYLPICSNAKLLIVPDIAGFVGADTVACVLATKLAEEEEITLMVDIGTNGEIVLGNRERMVSCAAAAGPALEGASISCGMRGQVGAIDHVYLEEKQLRCSVIGGGEAKGICGSGLIDALAAARKAGWLNRRGNILRTEGEIPLQDGVTVNQADVRQVQLAKGAIAAGIELLASKLRIPLAKIDRVYLAGAFGNFMDPEAACDMGLLPAALRGKIQAVGNAALKGGCLLACDRNKLKEAEELVSRIEFVELATMPRFPNCFAKHMGF